MTDFLMLIGILPIIWKDETERTPLLSVLSSKEKEQNRKDTEKLFKLLGI